MEGQRDRVRDVMVSPAVTLFEDATVAEAVNLFVERWLSGAPVVDSEGKLVGILTDGDLVRSLAATGIGYASAFRREDDIPDLQEEVEERVFRLALQPISQLMTRQVVTVHPDTPLAEAAALLDRYRIKKLPVVEEDRLVGILSRSDIVLGVLAQLSRQLSSEWPRP
ncbi:MAG: CBS domain-containing protein [Bacillota bacterium]|nr:CBS domain-containing protein [Bacillota bacterium]